MMSELLGYYLADNELTRKSLKKCQDIIKGVIPVWIEIKAEGSVLIKREVKQENELLKDYFSPDEISPLLQNYNLKNEESNKLLENRTVWGRMADKIIKFLQKNKLTSLNINIEGINSSKEKKLNQFIQFFSKKVKKHKIKLEVSIPAKIEDNNSNWGGAYNYKYLGKVADKLMIMAYDYHWSGGPPGAIAPFFWVRDVIDYSLMSCPPGKIYLGLPCYGYDWVVNCPGKKGRGLSYYQVMKIREKYSCQMDWDYESRSPFIKYSKNGQQHEVWFENGKSLKEKIKLVQTFELGGAVFWRLGLEDLSVWDKI